MNATSPEKTESTETDENLAAVSDVEAGIRDFVRNDVAYLRRPGAGMASRRRGSIPARRVFSKAARSS